MHTLADPDPGVVCPMFALMVLALWLGIRFLKFTILKLFGRRTRERRGFEVIQHRDDTLDERVGRGE